MSTATLTREATDSLFLSLAQAAAVTGSSEGRVRYNRERLIDLGAVVSDEGWRIPLKALVTLGWVDAPVARERVATLHLSPVQVMEVEVARLRAENEHLRSELEKSGSISSRLFGRRRRD